jgi:hypothetical protein
MLPDATIVAAEPDWQALGAKHGEWLTDGAAERYEAFLARWADIHGLKPSELVRKADTEDWIENAIKLISAVDTGFPVYVVERTGPREALKIGARFNTAAEFDHKIPTVFQGTILRFDPCFNGTEDINFVWPTEARLGISDYWADETMLRALGRRAAVSTGNSDGARGYVETTLDLRADGAKDLLAKIVFQAKYQAPARLSLMPDADAGDVRSAFYTAFEDNLLDCEDREACFLIQEVRPMIHEYRIIVVGGKPVAGAGTVEWLCPIFHDAMSGPFDPLVETKRNDRKLVAQPQIVERFVERAKELCADLEARGSSGFRNCTMDFALDAETGNVLLVETNPADNFGLYALDYARVLDAIVAETNAPRMAPERILKAVP